MHMTVKGMEMGDKHKWKKRTSMLNRVLTEAVFPVQMKNQKRGTYLHNLE